jgi:Bacterial Ig-like domain (group 1)
VRINLTDTAAVSTLTYFTFDISSPTNATLVRRTQTIDIVPGSFVAVDAPSSVVASIPSVPANGIAQSTITVTLKGATGVVLPDKIVTLAPNSGAAAVVSPASVATDGNGQASFSVSDLTVQRRDVHSDRSANQTIPNLVIAPVGADGKVELYNGSGGIVQLIGDVSGWFSS